MHSDVWSRAEKSLRCPTTKKRTISPGDEEYKDRNWARVSLYIVAPSDVIVTAYYWSYTQVFDHFFLLKKKGFSFERAKQRTRTGIMISIPVVPSRYNRGGIENKGNFSLC